MFSFIGRISKNKTTGSIKRTRFTPRVESLEDRRLMAGMPYQLNSLPGSPNTLYLDFDGDTQAVWTDTDRGVRYTNVNAAPYDIDGKPGDFSGEEENIRKIWQLVAEDYAPFNINVTTVEPKAGDNQAMRIVMSGNYSANYYGPNATSKGVWENSRSKGSNFMVGTDPKSDIGQILQNSGYSAGDSFTSAEPHVVYVFLNSFAKDPSMIGNTASHESGHTFGLVHDQLIDKWGHKTNEYDPGDGMRTPIMGANLAGARHTWTLADNLAGNQDEVSILTNVLKARVPDNGGNFLQSTSFTFENAGGSGWGDYLRSGKMTGVISTLSEADWYNFRSTGNNYQVKVNSGAYANLDAKLEIYLQSVVIIDGRPMTYPKLVATVDPALVVGRPFDNLSASWTGHLNAGRYFAVVRSHGDYGDLGQYTLSITETIQPLYSSSPRLTDMNWASRDSQSSLVSATLSGETSGGVGVITIGSNTSYSSSQNYSSGPNSVASNATKGLTVKLSKSIRESALDKVFADWA